MPTVVHPIRPIDTNENISRIPRMMEFITLHILKDYYPDAFFLFVHIPKTGGTTFNVRSCPIVLQDCGESCGCGNCGFPFFNSGEVYPDVNNLMLGSCPMLSYEINYPGFKLAVWSPPPLRSRRLHMITLIREPYGYTKSQIGHFLMEYKEKYKAGDRSQKTMRCLKPIQHFNTSAGCSNYSVGDGQTRWLADGNLKLALSLIRSMFAIGLTEFHEESMCLFQYQLGQFNHRRCNFKYIRNLKSVHQNTRLMNNSDLIAELDKSPGLLEVIEKRTAADRALYAEAKKIFFTRIRYVEMEKKVRIFDTDNKEVIKNFPLGAAWIAPLDSNPNIRYAQRHNHPNLRQDKPNYLLHESELGAE